MTTETWFGGTGNFRTAHDWSPQMVPRSGDTAIIQTGTVKLDNTIQTGVTLDLLGASPATEPVLALKNVVLNDTINLIGPPPSNGAFGEITVGGIVISTGAIQLSAGPPTEPGFLTMALGHHSAFINTGTISVLESSNLTVTGPENAAFINNGTLRDESPFTTFNVAVGGTGTFQLGPATTGAGLTFGDDVGSDVTVNFAGGGHNILTIDEPMHFLGGITGFGGNAEIDLPNIAATSESFANNELSLFDGGTLVAKLHVIGAFMSSSFTLTHQNGGTVITDPPPPTGTMLMPNTLAQQTFVPPRG